MVQGFGEREIIDMISNDPWMMHALRIVQRIDLPDWCICAGFIRAKVWDYLHGYGGTKLPDVDVVYFDAAHIDEVYEKRFEAHLRELDASIPWSVKNQARMHMKNGHPPYESTVDGIANFPEVCTAIGAYLAPNGEVRLIAPYGVDDLINMVVRPTPFFMREDKRGIYEHRRASKNWKARWERLQIVDFK